MKTLIDMLREIKTADDSNINEILKEAWETHGEIFTGVQLSMDERPLSMSRVPGVEGDDSDDEIQFNDFENLWNLLTSETVNSEDSNVLVCEMALMASVVEWNEFYRPILLKTLHKNCLLRLFCVSYVA